MKAFVDTRTVAHAPVLAPGTAGLAMALALGACSAPVTVDLPAAPVATDQPMGQLISADEQAANMDLSGDAQGWGSGSRWKVVARGIPGAGAITQVGTFHRGSPLHDNPTLAAFTQPGRVLDAHRLLIASTSNFGAPVARPDDGQGAVLSLDVGGDLIDVPDDFATGGTPATTVALDGRVQLYTAQSPAFLNSVNNPNAITRDLPAASLPLGISLNRGFGRPWIANSPNGADGAGTITVDDPSGAPLAGAPFAIAGGVFSGDATNRGPGTTHGLTSGAVATALITKSPDGTGKAVFLAALADGSVVQVHVAKGVDGLAPAGTFGALPAVTGPAAESNFPGIVTRVGIAFNWVPTRIAYVTDPTNNRVVALDLSDDGVMFGAAAPRYLTSWGFNTPVDIAPAIPEAASDQFASNTTLGGGSDLYVLNRGSNTIVRITQAGRYVASRAVFETDAELRVNGLAVSEDAQTLWVTAVGNDRVGVVVQMPAFGAGLVTPRLIEHARSNGATDVVGIGRDMFSNKLTPFQGLGPLFNDTSCAGCHNSTAPGGMGLEPDDKVILFGSLASGVFDPLTALHGPVSRRHSIKELGFWCTLPTGVPAEADVTSPRSAMTTAGTALIDGLQERDILANQALEPAAVRGKTNRVPDGRMGRFGWKAQVASLVEFMGAAFRNELGVTNPLFPTDVRGCGLQLIGPEIDGVPLQAVAAYLGSIDPPVPAAECLGAPGAAVFEATGCASCHTPSFAGPGRRVNLYSDLLLHDMGPGLDDLTPQGLATGRDWRTMPLWRVSERGLFLHDGRAKSISEAVSAHGGQAADSAAAFEALDPDAKQALLDFLGCI